MRIYYRPTPALNGAGPALWFVSSPDAPGFQAFYVASPSGTLKEAVEGARKEILALKVDPSKTKTTHFIVEAGGDTEFIPKWGVVC